MRKTALQRAMSEVHTNIPRTVRRANVAGKQREKMLEAIAYAKVRRKK